MKKQNSSIMSLCQYRNIFGKPNSGAHSYRIFNIAIIDLGLTILVAYIISKYYILDFVYVFIILMLLSLILHKLFCVETTLTKFVFE
jgi:hypothetical protein